MEQKLVTISKRAQAILANPQYLNSSINDSFQVTLDLSDKILTVHHSGKQGEIELILSEALIVFAKNQSLNDLWKINFREVENYLRDENHLPAFSADLVNLEEKLNLLKISLIAAGLRARSKEDLSRLASVVFDWEKHSLVTKNIWARDFLAVLGFELIFCDGQTLTLTKVPGEATNSDLEYLFKHLLGSVENDLPMKVVAVQ